MPTARRQRVLALQARATAIAARLDAERGALGAACALLRRPLRRADNLGQGMRYARARLDRLRGLRAVPGVALAMLPGLCWIARLVWQARPAMRAGVRVWGVLRIARRVTRYFHRR